MDKIRFKQAQKLITEVGKSKKTQEILKKPKEGIIDSKIFGDIINEMIDLEEFLYTSRPTHYLKLNDAQDFCAQIILIRNQIDDILADFGVIEKLNVEEEIKTLSDNYLILTTKSNFKKVLTKLAVDPQKIIVAGVPLQIEDMKTLNPRLPDNALESIEKKISHVKNDINRKKEQFNLENILVVVEKDRAGEILADRAEEIYSAEIISIEGLKDITAGEFLKLLSGL
ncbi:MAG: DUF2100 domain-containing protein [Methanothermobacter sp.]